MISHLTGTVLFIGERAAVLDVCGVGYAVFATLETLRKIKRGETAELWTHLAVREDSLALYGFPSKGEVEFFELLLSVSGIGPKSALVIMNVAQVDTLRSAIAAGDTSYLTKVSGIGKKSAEKIIVELKDKLGALAGGTENEEFREESDAVDALRALGYTVQEARDALKDIPQDVRGTSERVKRALKVLGS